LPAHTSGALRCALANAASRLEVQAERVLDVALQRRLRIMNEVGLAVKPDKSHCKPYVEQVPAPRRPQVEDARTVDDRKRAQEDLETRAVRRLETALRAAPGGGAGAGGAPRLASPGDDHRRGARRRADGMTAARAGRVRPASGRRPRALSSS
jgi:hypothetical protein